jgi:predicted membrane protein (TIGR00267 family)
MQDAISAELSRDKTKWVEFMMRFELGMEKPDEKRASKSAFNIGLSYIIGGIVPLMGYFFTKTPREGLIISSTVTILFLFIFGYIKTKVTGNRPFIGGLKTVVTGVLAAGAAFFIAKLIS